MNTYISIDVGGTQIRVAVYPAEGIDPLRIKKIATKGIGTAVERIIATVKELWRKEENVKAIAICVPGPVDPEAGIIFTAANVPEWNNIPLRDILQNEFHVPVFLGNDANLAALAEWQFGAGRGHRNLIYLTISTGVGGGVIMDGNLLLGYRGLGAELGHVIVQPDGAMCGCGNRGHIESYSSGTGIANFVKEQLATGRASSLANEEKITAKEVAKAAKAGDELALEAFANASKYLAIGIANYLHIFSPTVFVFGGGVSQVGDLLFDPIRKMLPNMVYSDVYLENLSLVTAELGDDVSLLGCLALARMETE